MYEHFFRLKAEPFRLSPDHRFCYNHPQYAKAKAYMAYAFMRAEGFVMVTGQPGTGKTTLIGDLVESLADENVVVANLVSTQLADGRERLWRLSARATGILAEPLWPQDPRSEWLPCGQGACQLGAATADPNGKVLVEISGNVGGEFQRQFGRADMNRSLELRAPAAAASGYWEADSDPDLAMLLGAHPADGRTRRIYLESDSQSGAATWWYLHPGIGESELEAFSLRRRQLQALGPHGERGE